MKKVYKYTILRTSQSTVEDHLLLPRGAQILSVAEQRDEIVLYAVTDNLQTEYENYRIHIAGTGHPLPDDIDTARFLGTVNLMEGSLMFHVYVWPLT